MPAKRRILVVDDDRFVLSVVARVLQKEGYDVVAVKSGELACEATLTERFDLVVTDHCMPGMTGKQLVDILRQRHPSLPILQISGANDSESLVADDVRSLAKPFDIRALRVAVHSLLPVLMVLAGS